MAELPDLTAFANILSRRFNGKVLEHVEVTISKKLNVDVDFLKSALEGEKLQAVIREGKTLQFHFSAGRIFGLHLMLRGELIAIENVDIPRFQIIALDFKGGNGFAVIDLQQQAPPTFQPKSVIIPDALALDKIYFKSLLAKKHSTIKTLLMDQKLLRGIGNSYSDEILYHAKVSPLSKANALPEKIVDKIFESIEAVLNKAIKNIEDANGDKLTGELKDFMEIHNPNLNIQLKTN